MRGGSKHSPTDWNLSKSHLAVWHFSHSPLNWCGMFFSGLLYLANDWRYTLGRFHSTKSHPSVCIDPISLIQLLTRLLYIRIGNINADRQVNLEPFLSPPSTIFTPCRFSRLIYFHPLCSIGFVSLRFSPSTWFLRLSKTRLHSPRHVSDERRKDVCPIIVPIVPHCFSIAPAFSWKKENLRKASIVSCFALYRIIDDGNSRRG